MSEIKCPHCGKVFTVDPSDYNSVINQIRDHEFDKEVEKRVNEVSNHLKKQYELEQSQAVMDAEAKFKDSNAKEMKKLQNKLQKAEQTNAKLESQIKLSETEKTFAVLETKQKIETEYQSKLQDKEKELEYYKELKIRASTKMIGESLEKHCEDDYNMHLRSLLPNAYFEKDNEISESGSKGDYIFREEQDGVELVSIMFEMKNEMETTATKHKNEHFFKELDKDRKEKNCEYAVLVSLLEADSEYYNQGIVDVSHKYEKMYVIRPQFLCPLITLLRNASLNSFSYRTELADMRMQNIDTMNFEDELDRFKEAFGKNCIQTSKRFQDAIAQIDKSIKDLEKVKEALTLSEKHMNAADNKLEDLTIKKLTKNSPLMREKFEEARKTHLKD